MPICIFLYLYALLVASSHSKKKKRIIFKNTVIRQLVERREEPSFTVYPFECCVLSLYYLVQKILCIGLSKRVSSFQICYFYYQNQASYHQRKFFFTGVFCLLSFTQLSAPLLNFIQTCASARSLLQASLWEWIFRATNIHKKMPMKIVMCLPAGPLQENYLQKDSHRQAKDIQKYSWEYCLKFKERNKRKKPKIGNKCYQFRAKKNYGAFIFEILS